MAEMELVAPERKAEVVFAVEPAHNGLSSLLMLGTQKPGMPEWITRMSAELSPELLDTNHAVCHAASTNLCGVSWPSFSAWLDDLAKRDATSLRDQELEELLKKAAVYMETDDLPLPEKLLEKQANYLTFIQELMDCKGGTMTVEVRERYERRHKLLNDPPARQELIVSHLRIMWDSYLAEEWERCLPMIQDSVAAFETLDYANMPAAEILIQVAERDSLPDHWDELIGDVDRLHLVPSAHMGPSYMMLLDICGNEMWVIVRARVPRGATVISPALSRSELIMRLGALTDDTRLRILELLAQEGEQDSKAIMTKLDLSQSSASRHLGQLSATGYLIVQHRDGVKHFRINRERIDDSFGALKEFLR